MRQKISAQPAPRDVHIGQLARRTGVKAVTIRFYEREGILPEPTRGDARYRVYAAADIERLLFVRRARDLGFSLDQVRDLLSLADEPARPCTEVDALARANLEQVNKKVLQLQELQRELSRVISQCRGGLSVADCQILAVLGRTDS